MRSANCGISILGWFWHSQTVEHRTGGNSVPLAHGDSIAGRAGHDGRHAVDHRHLRNGCVLGEQAAAELGIRMALGAQRKEVLQAALGRRSNCWRLVRRRDWFWELLATPGAGFHRVSGHAARSAGIGWRCCWRWRALGLLATWIPAQRALSVNPLVLLREESGSNSQRNAERQGFRIAYTRMKWRFMPR
jgi:hypothetical protein